MCVLGFSHVFKLRFIGNCLLWNLTDTMTIFHQMRMQNDVSKRVRALGADLYNLENISQPSKPQAFQYK